MSENDFSSSAPVQRRVPFKEKKINEITQDDIKVRFVGMVIEKGEDVLVVDDGTGQVKVSAENAGSFGINSNVRVFGRVIPVEGGVEISAEIVQDMTGADIGLYRRITEEEKEIFV